MIATNFTKNFDNELFEAKVQSIIQLTDPSEFFPAKETKLCEEEEEVEESKGQKFSEKY